MRSFTEIPRLHAELEELFFAHQRALLRFDLKTAADKLADYEEALLEHIRVEDELLIPLYSERAEPVRGSAPEFYYGEHRKLLEFIDLFKRKIPLLAEGEERERRLIKLLDAEATFKHLLEHHHEREEKFLFPALDRAVPEEERAQLLAEVTRSHRALARAR